VLNRKAASLHDSKDDGLAQREKVPLRKSFQPPLWQVMPKPRLPRHMFCIAVRKAARGHKDEIGERARHRSERPA
jgi:hypothetical protein